MNTFPLEERVCLITGGLGGIGLAVADLVLKRGGKVFLGDLKGEEEGTKEAREGLKNYSAKRVGYGRCDVTDRAEFEACFLKCKEVLGVPDILINNAGVCGEQRWDKIYDVNVKGTHCGIELAFKHMKKEDAKAHSDRVVVNMSSTSGITCIGDMFTTPAYTASKHAVTAMTRSFGHDFHFARTGVRVVALAPYFVETPMNENSFAQWTEDEEARAIIEKEAAGKPFLKTDEVALKLINIFSAKNGSIWMIRPNQMQPFNIPDFKLPHTQGYRSIDSYPKPKLYC